MSMKRKKASQKKRNDFFFVTKHIKFAWVYIILALVATVTATSIAGEVPDMTAQLFDGNFEMSRLWEVIKTTLLSTAITAVGTVFTILAESKSLLSARTSAWEYMLNTQSRYYDDHDPGSLFSMVTFDMEQMSRGLVTIFTAVPRLITMIALAVVMILGYNPRLLMVFWIIIPMHLLYMFFVGRWQQRIGLGISSEVGNLSGYLSERIRNMMMIRSFSAQTKEFQNGLAATGKLHKVMKKYSWLSVILGSYSLISAAVTTVATVLWGCHLLSAGEITLPDFIGFNSYVAVVNVAFVFVSIVWTYLKDFQGRAHRLAELLDSPREDDSSRRKQRGITDIPSGGIEVKNMSFSYGGDETYALKDMNFTIPAGKVTAIVGPSGSGKTTMIKLLERLYDPTVGNITVGGIDIGNFNLHAWRNKLSYVVQDAGVFGGTVRDALCYGSEQKPTDEELMNVVDQVGLRDFVNTLPQKLDTVLGTWGGTISGGQRQRIVIARALQQNADILIFDEPTSALDPETANAISAMILEKFQGKTVIVISHELNYIAAADHIVVINQGQLEGSGKHDVLMRESEIYRDLVQQQSYQEVFGV